MPGGVGYLVPAPSGAIASTLNEGTISRGRGAVSGLKGGRTNGGPSRMSEEYAYEDKRKERIEALHRPSEVFNSWVGGIKVVTRKLLL